MMLYKRSLSEMPFPSDLGLSNWSSNKPHPLNAAESWWIHYWSDAADGVESDRVQMNKLDPVELHLVPVLLLPSANRSDS